MIGRTAGSVEQRLEIDTGPFKAAGRPRHLIETIVRSHFNDFSNFFALDLFADNSYCSVF